MEACSTGQTESLRFMVPDSYNRMMSLAGSGFKMEEDHLNIKIVKALLFIMPAHYFNYIEICVTKMVNLRFIPLGLQPLKKKPKLTKSS